MHLTTPEIHNSHAPKKSTVVLAVLEQTGQERLGYKM